MTASADITLFLASVTLLLSPLTAQSQVGSPGIASVVNRNYTQDLLRTRDSITAAARLTPLNAVNLPPGQQEIRIWKGWGLFVPEDLYRISRKDGVVVGEWYRIWTDPARDSSDSYGVSLDSLLLHQMKGQCEFVGYAGRGRACRARLTSALDWKFILEAMEHAGLWSLSDESELPDDGVITLDGWGLLVEVRNGGHYRAYHHSNPDAHVRIASKKAVDISHALEEIERLLRPGDNWLFYRGRLSRNSRTTEFQPCEERRTWVAQGSLPNLTEHTGDLYIEGRGLKELPGTTEKFEPGYQDGIIFDSLYVVKPWVSSHCAQ